MNKFLGLGFGLVGVDTCRPSSLHQAKLVTAVAAMLALSTCAYAAKRHVGNAPGFATYDAVPIRVVFEPSLYWMYRLCSPAALAADPYTVCFPVHGVRPYRGRDPDINIRFDLRRRR
jgi:hypothetical protein